MIIAVNIDGDVVGGGLGRAQTIAVAEVKDGQIVSWQEEPVRWDLAHEQVESGAVTGGSHHARIVSFLREHKVDVVVAGHVGPPMMHTLELLGVRVVTTTGSARQAVLDAART